MKRFTILLLMLFTCFAVGYGQCINTNVYPSDPHISDNSGYDRTIDSCVYTDNDYTVVTELLPGSTYVFSCRSNESQENKYITITDNLNEVIAHGPSPLTVAVDATSIRLHYAENEACDGNQDCCTAKVKLILSCPFPTDIAISGITTSNASFAWTPGAAETAWEVLVLGANDEDPVESTTGTEVVGDPEFTYSGLTSANQYKFFLRSDCGSEFSPWSGPYNFASGCDPIAVLQEGFENVEVPGLPICWTSLLVGAAEFASVETTFISNTGSYAVQLSNDDSAPTSNILLISPAMSTVSTGTHRVKFFARSFGNAPLQVGTVNTTTADAVFTSLQSFNVGEDYTEYTVDFTGYEGEDTYFAFRHPSPETYNPVFIDDVRWELAPLCPDVQNITIASASVDAANITWTGDSESEWDVVFGTDGSADPATLIPISPAPQGEPEATISGLMPDTDYSIWVRSACGGTEGDGAWIGPVSFRTPCLPISTFNENFNAIDYGELPACWSAIIAGESVSNDAFVFVTDDGLTDSNGAELSNADSGTDDEIILVSPNLSTLTTGTHRLKFYARSGASIEVGTLSSPIGQGNFTPFETIQLTPNYAEYVVDFSSYSGTDTYVGIRHMGEPYFRILIDNIRWELTPECPDVTAIAVNEISSDSASLSWESQGTENEWNVVIGSEDDTDPTLLTPISPAPTGSPELALTGLTDNTAYNIWIRSACGGTAGDGAWIGPVPFRTACIAATDVNESFETTAEGDVPDCWTALLFGPTIPEYAAVRTVPYEGFTGDNSVEIWPSDAGTDDYVMLVSPALNTIATATHRIKLRAFAYDPATIVIGTLDGNSSNSIFTPFEQIAVTGNYTEFVINFDSYSGTDMYFALRNITQFTSVFVDDVRWEPIPDCPDVTGITISDPATDGISVGWVEEGGESFQLAYGAADVTDPDTLTPTPAQTDSTYTITGLMPGQMYNVWVRSVCGGAGNGAWMGPYAFSTLCLPVTLPFTEDFESVETPMLPSCSVLQNVGAGNLWETEEAPGFGFESKTLVYSYDSDAAANVWYYTRGIMLTGGTEYTISYRYGNNSENNYVEKLKVAYGINPQETAMTETLADHPEINTGMPLSNMVTFTPAESGVYYFGFNAYSIPNQYDLYLDDIVIDTALGTPSVPDTAFTYYPNPVSDILHVSGTEVISDVKVYNLLGQEMISLPGGQKEISVDMSSLSSGSYIIKLSSDNFSKTIKVIKK